MEDVEEEDVEEEDLKEENREEEDSEEEDLEVQEAEGGEDEKDEESKRKILELSSKIANQIIEALKPTIEEIKNEVKSLCATVNQKEDERNQMVTELVEKTNDMVDNYKPR